MESKPKQTNKLERLQREKVIRISNLIMRGNNGGDIMSCLPVQIQNILTKKLPRQIHIISSSFSLGSYINPRILQFTFP
jgi:hypothetical protein